MKTDYKLMLSEENGPEQIEKIRSNSNRSSSSSSSKTDAMENKSGGIQTPAKIEAEIKHKSEDSKGCLQALKDQSLRFCSPHTAVPIEWADGKKKPSLYGPYGLSSFTYSILGIWIFIFVRDVSVLGTPFYIDGTLLFLQGIVSYGCDVYTFGCTSIFKIFDRCSALIQGIWWLAKLFYVRMTVVEYIIFIGSALIATACKFKGEVSMRNLQWTQFLIFHSLWHLFVPLGLFVWAYIRND